MPDGVLIQFLSLPLASGSVWALVGAAAAMATACALLSPLVVARRWAFICEGVGHSGFGGAGVVWLLSLVLPGVAMLRESAGVTIGVAVFSLLAALIVGRIAERKRLGALGFDTATGIVLTASLAFGFLAREVFREQTGVLPIEAHSLLFGGVRDVSATEAVLTIVTALCVTAALVLGRREVLAWAFDPELAQVSGVPTRAVHYGLLIALAATIVVGARLVGVVLVTALLVLPGAASAVWSGARHGGGMGRLFGVSLGVGLVAVGGAVALRLGWRVLPLGPVVVLLLVVVFGVVALAARVGEGREGAGS